jgi:hypothetical protein
MTTPANLRVVQMKGFVPMSSSRREGLAREALENGKELAGNGVHHL